MTIETYREQLDGLAARIADFERRHPYATEAAAFERCSSKAFAAYYDSWEFRRNVLADRLKAMRCAVTSTDGDIAPINFPPVERFWIRALCIWALIWNRSGFDKHAGKSWDNPKHELNALDVGGWAFAKSYAGWSETILHFHPAQVRFEITEDGDWCM